MVSLAYGLRMAEKSAVILGLAGESRAWKALEHMPPGMQSIYLRTAVALLGLFNVVAKPDR